MLTKLNLGMLLALLIITTGCMPRIELDLVTPGDYEQTIEWEEDNE